MQNQSEQIHGLVGEPIPEWSRIYKGPYYLGKIGAGWKISEESERIAEEAYTSVEKGKEMPPRKKIQPKEEPKEEPKPEPKPEPKVEPKVEPKPEPKPEPKVEPKVEPKPEPQPEPKPKAKRPPPKKKTDLDPTAFIDPTPQPEVEVITVKVKPTEIDGRKVYLSNLKDKVYDMKYNYLGRYNRKADKIETSYPDSDA
jgi:outer membrane biosynthesis protein TonB